MEGYRQAIDLLGQVFRFTKTSPGEEISSLTDQIRRSKRPVSAMTTKGGCRRKYVAAPVDTLNPAEGEAAETQSGLEPAVPCEYLPTAEVRELHRLRDLSIGKLVTRDNQSQKWVSKRTLASDR